MRGVFGVSPWHASGFSLSRIEPILEAAHERLEAVVFECLDWAELVSRYDTPDTLFYLDPPYLGGEDDYGKGIFDRAQYARMAEALAAIKGGFILSINDTPETRAIFAAFILEPVRLTYSISAGGGTPAGELIITNRDLKTRLI